MQQQNISDSSDSENDPDLSSKVAKHMYAQYKYANPISVLKEHHKSQARVSLLDDFCHEDECDLLKPKN